MESLDVFVLPSFTEGTPNSIIEAMACSKPIIASDVGGIPDMVGDDAGILVPPGDISALASAMLRLSQQPESRQQMGQAAYRQYERLFSPEAVVPLMLETYARVVKNGQSGIGDNSGNNHHPWAEVVRPTR